MIETPTMTEVEQLRQLCSRQENQIEVQEERLEEGTRDLQQGRLALQKANQATESAKNELMEINSHLEQAALCAQEMASNAAMANAAKSEFLASMSHEIRTPMNGVIGMIDLLLDTGLQPEQREFADTARHSAEGLLTILNDVLDFSKIEAGKMTVEPIPFDLNVAIDEVAEIQAAKAEEKYLDLIVRYAPEVPNRVIGDSGRIRQVVINLLSNAIKFTEKGHVLVNVELRKQATQSGENHEVATIYISVEDTGIGISDDKLDAVFDHFTQADSSTTRQYGGTGLGLSISRQLIELMKGRIGVESEQGKGSKFWVELPLPVDSEIDSDPLPMAELNDVRVLIVDDNYVNRRVVKEQLSHWSIPCECAGDAEEALCVLHEAFHLENPYQIAILDHHMPAMNGEILGQRIKEDSDLKDTSLVMLTSVGQRGEADRFSAIGFAAYLVKPVRRLQLKEVLSTVWGVSQKGLNSQMVTRHTLAELSSDEHSEVTNQPAGQVAHVLVAEDNIVNQKVASLILEKLGCKVDLVNNGQEALDAVRVNDYSLVFMDCQMPVLDGFETTKALRASEDAKIPIIAMTANALRGDRERCLNVGMDDYISKPVKAEYFESILKRWLNRTEVPISDDLVPEIKPERPYINECAIDEHVITSLRELTDDKFFIENLFIAYIEDAQKRLIGLKTAAKEGDYDQLNMTAHAMKVASQNIGARRMSELCLKLEHCPESESNQEVLFLVGCVEEELGEIIEVYPQMLLS